MIRNYNLFAFEKDEDWTEDDRITAKLAHENALRMLRTLFNNLPEFKTKAAATGFLAENFTNKDPTKIDMLAESCEQQLATAIKHPRRRQYKEAKTLTALRAQVDPLVSATSSFDLPALWPLVSQVSIGVRGSRVLDRITLVDLPGKPPLVAHHRYAMRLRMLIFVRYI